MELECARVDVAEWLSAKEEGQELCDRPFSLCGTSVGIGIAEMQIAEGKLHLFAATDRTSNFAQIFVITATKAFTVRMPFVHQV